MRLAALALVLLGACRAAPPTPRPEVREPIAPRADPSLRSVDDGIGAYKAERYPEAAWCFAEIAAGRIPGDRPRAEFWLGKSAIRIDDDERAIGIFVAIAGDPEHPSHTLALPWLAYLRVRHPDDARLDRAIARYPLAVLEDEALRGVLDQLQVAFAAQRLRSADAAGAYALAVAVAAGTDAHREAQLIAGLAADRLGREGEAISHLRAAATPTKRASAGRRRAPPTEVEIYDATIQRRARQELQRLGAPAPTE